MDYKTKRRLEKLDALEAGGVDNWDGYEISLESWIKDGEVDAEIEKAIDSINDILAVGKVDFPAGRDAGHSIKYDEESLRVLLRRLINEAR